MAVELFSVPLRRRFFARRTSLTYCMYLVGFWLLIIIPFLLAYQSSGAEFWLKTNTYYEQPSIQYERKLLLVVEGTKGGGAPLTLFYSTMGQLNGVFASLLRVPVIRTRDTDDNLDGQPERMRIQAEVPVLPDEDVLSVKLFAFFECRLRKLAKATVHSMVYVEAASPLSGRAVSLDADLALRQRWPLRLNNPNYVEDPILDPKVYAPWLTGDESIQGFLPNLVHEYNRRNVTTLASNTQVVWTGQGAAPSQAVKQARSFNITATIEFPLQKVWYSPALSEILMDAWVKYLALLVLFIILVGALARFALENQILENYVRVDGAPAATVNRFKTHKY